MESNSLELELLSDTAEDPSVQLCRDYLTNCGNHCKKFIHSGCEAKSKSDSAMEM